MNFRISLCTLTACTIAWCGLSYSQAGEASKFKKGDRVEVKRFDKWLKGVVVGIDERFDDVTVRLDDDERLPKRLPPEHRERFLTKDYDVEDVRLIAEPKAPAPQVDLKPRVWKDRTGKFNITATYRGMRDGKVVLETDKGKQIEVPLDKLADDDANYARQQDNDSENPFAAATNDAISQTPTPPGPKLTPANIKSVKVLTPKTFSSWTYKPEYKPVVLNSQLAGQQLNLEKIPNSKPVFEKLEKMYVSDDGGRVIVARKQGVVSDEESYVQDINLAEAKAGSPVMLPSPSTLLSAWPNEGLIAVRPDHFGSGKNNIMTIAKLQGDQLVPVISWMPYEDEDWAPRKDVEDAWFLSRDRIMTANDHPEMLTIWSISDARALCRIPIQPVMDMQIAFSPDQKTLAIAMDQGVAFIDTEAGTHVATLPTGEQIVNGMAFSDDAGKLATRSSNGIAVWDLTTGKQICEFWHPEMGTQSQLSWAGNLVAVGGRYLFDPERRILLWEYRGGKQSLENFAIRNGRFFAASKPSDKYPAMCFTAKFPHAAAVQLASQLGSPEDLLIAKPGDKCAIKVELDAGLGSPDEVRSAIAANLTAAGFQVADEADLLVTAICKQKEQQTIKINTGRDTFRVRPEDIVEKTVTPHASFIQLTLKGEKVWERGYVAQPGTMIWLNSDETLDQALARLTQPNIDVLKNTKFAPYLARPGKATPSGAYGSSTYATGE